MYLMGVEDVHLSILEKLRWVDIQWRVRGRDVKRRERACLEVKYGQERAPLSSSQCNADSVDLTGIILGILGTLGTLGMLGNH